MRWRKSKEPSRSSSDLTAFIDEGSEIEGKCTFGGTVITWAYPRLTSSALTMRSPIQTYASRRP